MKLTAFNGSPRGKGSNTKILLDQFIDGFMRNSDNSHEIAYLNKVKDAETFSAMFKEAEQVLLAFPLYHDSMPAIVKSFIEMLKPFGGRQRNPGIGFIVQSGFPESIHSKYVERYLEKLSKRLRCQYLGTIIKGGVERIKARPPWMTRKLFKSFYQLGKTFGETAEFDSRIITKLAKPERFSKIFLLLFKILDKTGLTEFYWNDQLKKNNAYEKRFDRPYK